VQSGDDLTKTPFFMAFIPVFRDQNAFMRLPWTVGRDEAVVREYIRGQEKEDQRLEQLNLWR